MEKKSIRRWAFAFFFVFFIAFYCSRHWFQLLLIQGDSMQPAYRHLQLVVLDKRGREYTYGDVVAFGCSGLHAVLVKRIAAVPGDSVQIRDGTLFVNHRKSRIYPEEGIFSYAGEASAEIVLSGREYFVIGDNVGVSRDSRYEEVGLVEGHCILGYVLKVGECFRKVLNR